MIEAYAFLAMFTVQILAMSVLHPAWLSRYVRAKQTDFPDEYFAQLYPGIDRHQATTRFVTRYRAANAVIAMLGVFLLGWMFRYMRHPDWNEGPVIVLLSVYFVIQMVPLCLIALLSVRYRKVLSHFLEGKRKAVLQRRGLFDFVSPFTVFLAVLGYFLFAAFVIYFQPQPFPGFALIGALTLVYVVQAFLVYTQLYGKKNNPFETHAGRVHTIGQAVKSGVYGCLLCVVFFSFIFAVDLLDQKRWVPFAQTVCLVLNTFLCFMVFTAPPRRPEADGLESGGRLTSGTRDLSA